MAKKIIKRRGYRREYDEFHQAMAGMYGAPITDGGAVIPDGLLRREFAWRPANAVSEVFVPIALAGVYASLAGTAGALAAHYAHNDILAIGGVSFLAIGALAFTVISKRQLDSMWTQEEFGDEEIEEPVRGAAPSAPVKIEFVEKAAQGARVKFANLPVDEQGLGRIAIHCVDNGKAFSRASLTGIVSQTVYPELRDEMLKAGWLRYADKTRKAVGLTPSGRAMLRHFRV